MPDFPGRTHRPRDGRVNDHFRLRRLRPRRRHADSRGDNLGRGSGVRNWRGRLLTPNLVRRTPDRFEGHVGCRQRLGVHHGFPRYATQRRRVPGPQRDFPVPLGNRAHHARQTDEPRHMNDRAGQIGRGSALERFGQIPGPVHVGLSTRVQRIGEHLPITFRA
jgi:hypothetical protein